MPSLIRAGLRKVTSGGGQTFATPPSWGQMAYGAGWPIAPVQAPQDVAIPRTIDYPLSVNAQIMPRTGYNLMPFAALLQAWENIAECKVLVNLLIRELSGLIPHLVGPDGTEIQDHPMQWLCESPDRRRPWSSFLTDFLKSAKVYDAPAVFLEQDRSGQIQRLEYIDGSTLFLIVDEYGRTPAPEPVETYVDRLQRQVAQKADTPATFDAPVKSLKQYIELWRKQHDQGNTSYKIPAYTQIIKGTPFSWWSSDQVWYMPQNKRLNAPYGESFIEQAWSWLMVIVNITAFELGFYRTGNMPEGWVTLPATMFPDMDSILDAEQTYNIRMTDNPATERNRIRFLPENSRWFATKKPDFPDKLYAQAWKILCHTIGIPPSEFGDIPGSGLGGKGFKEGAQSDLSRQTLDPHRVFISTLFNSVLERNGVDDAVFALDYPTEEIDPSKLKEDTWQQVIHGTLTLNDALGQLGMPSIGDPDDKDAIYNKHLIIAGSAIYVVEDMKDQGGMAVPTFTGKPQQEQLPAGPTGVPEADNAEHTPQDTQKLMELIRNLQDRGTLVNKFVSTPGETRASKIEANYTDVAMDKTQRCALCRYFVGGGTCQKVAGSISPNGWCKYFAPSAVNKSVDTAELAKHCGVCPDDDDYYQAPITRELTFSFPDGDHANAAEIVGMQPDDLPAKPAIFKPQAGERLALQDRVGGAMYPREEAVYLIDRSLGFMLVPVAYATEDANGERGAVVYYSYGAQPARETNDYAPEWIERAAILDYVCGQQDRIGGLSHNTLTHPDDPDRPILIDGGLTFNADSDPHIHSRFVDAWAGRPLSDDSLKALLLCYHDAATWHDIAALLGAAPTLNARARVKTLLDEKAIPNE